jgi:uncharacterized protein YfbU (UPF0304 family)
MMSDIKLSRIERWILTNQYSILERLDKDNGAAYARHRTALERGYEYEYSAIVEHIDEAGISAEDCKFVWDVLAMFDRIRLSSAEMVLNTDKCVTKFEGFDFNDPYEIKLGAYAKFVCSLNRFESLGKGDGFNAHWPMAAGYRRQLEVYKGLMLSGERSLTPDEIIKVGKAFHGDR